MRCPRRNCRAARSHRVRVRFLSGRLLDETLCEPHAQRLFDWAISHPQTVSGSMTPLVAVKAERRAA